jgi:toxin ParE1/3/4
VKSVRVEPDAKQELAAAARWYEQRREALGRELLAEIDGTLVAIARTPSRFPLYPRADPELGIRRVLVPRFPYALAFIDLGAVIRVVAVAHERQRPGYWLRRLDDQLARRK